MFHRLMFVSGAAFLASAAALAQPASPDAVSAQASPKPTTNAEAAALFKDVSVAEEQAPDPKRPPGGTTNTVHAIENFVPVTNAILRDPDPSNWIMPRGNYQGWGFSKLDQINKNNVKGLQLVWARQMELGPNESTPLVYNGVMFVPNPNGEVIQAIDAASGELLWQYHRRIAAAVIDRLGPWGAHPRNIAIWGDKLYATTRDNFLIALDARTGKELWQVNRGGDYYITNATGPMIVNGIVLAGSQCQTAPVGCFVDAHDAETGKLLWRNELIPHPGEPGDETWKNKPFNERWETDVWGLLTYDPDANVLYYGSSGIAPGSEAQRNQIGATLAGTDTRFAVDPKTGKIFWRHQVLPEDNWDQDCTFEMMPVTTPVHPDSKADGMFSVGRDAASASRKTLVGMPCKTGIIWSFDALTGDYLWSKSTVQQNLVSEIDTHGAVAINQNMPIRDVNKSYRICPSENGGREWSWSAYSPQTNVMYFQLVNLCATVKVQTDNIPSLPADNYNVDQRFLMAPGKTEVGRIDAVNVETGRTMWNWESKTSNYSPILVTAGGLLLNGGVDRNLRVQDQTTGQVLWQVRLGSSITAAPITFSVNGRQYIAVAGGGGPGGGLSSRMANAPIVDQPSGANMMYVFALPQ